MGATAAILADIIRRQRIHKLKHDITVACATAGTSFSWLRTQGLQQLLEVLAGALDEEGVLRAALEQTYSQVLEAVLSSLEKELLPLGLPASSAAAAQQLPASYQAGYALQHAHPQEWLLSFQALQVLCMFHPKVRQLMGTAQYLQMLTQRACRSPPALLPFMDLLLLVLTGSEEAQALFVTTGGLDALLAAALEASGPALCSPSAAQAAGSSAAAAAGAGARRDGEEMPGGSQAPAELLLMRLLVFLQMLQGWVLGEAVKRGAHPSTQKAAVQLVHQYLGSSAAVKLLSGLSQVVSSCSDVAALMAKGKASSGGLLHERALAARAVITPRGKT